MDYHSVNLFDKGNTIFQTKPGPYDIWAIEYGYSELTNYNSDNELLNIAKKHSQNGFEIMFDSGYGGEHWLATFAIYNFTR